MGWENSSKGFHAGGIIITTVATSTLPLLALRVHIHLYNNIIYCHSTSNFLSYFKGINIYNR